MFPRQLEIILTKRGLGQDKGCERGSAEGTEGERMQLRYVVERMLGWIDGRGVVTAKHC